MIADIISNKKLNLIVTKLFIRSRKLDISIVFIAQSYFKVPKDVRLNSTYFFIMKILTKRELQQIVLNHSSDIDFKDFMKIFKKCTTEPYSFSPNFTIRQSFKVQKESFEIIYNKIMTIEDKIRDEKPQYDINREAAKISVLSSGKIDKYEYLTGEEILPSNQQQIIEQTKFTYSPLGKAFEKQTKTIENQVDALESLKPSDKQLPPIRDFISKEKLNSEMVNEIERTEEEERKVDRSKIVYKASNEAYDSRKFKTMHVFGNEIRNNIIDMNMANDEQDQLLRYINKLKSKAKLHNPESKKVKEDVLNSARALLKGREMVFKAFESGIFLKPEESKQGNCSVVEKLEFKTGEDVLEEVEKFCYLGDMISCFGGASETVSARIGSAWKKFRELSGVLVGKQGLSLMQWGKIYQCCV